ncbi:MAG TPA: hypothetical protein VG318_15530 [Actinomycetota bacterium]|nr:hypothetical protein [Actinomycetota bacterium]
MPSKTNHLIEESEAIRKFREDRIAAIVSGRTPVPLAAGARVVLHVTAVNKPHTVDLQRMGEEMWRLAPLAPRAGFDDSPNFDGLLTYGGGDDGAYTYLQLFRDGSIETLRTITPRPESQPKIPSVNFEKQLIEALPRCLSIQKELGLDPPFVLMLSLLGVSGYAFAIDQRQGLYEEGGRIPQDRLLVRELPIETFHIDAAAVLKPLFDQIWNAAGWSGSLNYVNGEWTPPK